MLVSLYDLPQHFTPFPADLKWCACVFVNLKQGIFCTYNMRAHVCVCACMCAARLGNYPQRKHGTHTRRASRRRKRQQFNLCACACACGRSEKFVELHWPRGWVFIRSDLCAAAVVVGRRWHVSARSRHILRDLAGVTPTGIIFREHFV